MENKLHRKYGLFTAICMVVGIVIGSGVFFKAQNILEMPGIDLTLGIIAWLIGGAIMLVCLLAFSFMGQKYEKVNGLVDYAEATVGPNYGYFMGWFSSTIYYPAMTSVLAWLSARYTLEFITSAFPGFPLLITAENGGCAVGPECLALTLFYLCGCYAVNVLSPKLAGKLQVSTTVIKMIPLGLMSIVGVIAGLASGLLVENFSAPPTTAPVNGTSPLFAAVCATAFAYEGWIIATAMNAEIKDSKKNLPKALVLGGIVIVATYVLYFVGVAGGATTADLTKTGTTVAFNNVFGPVLGNILKLFVAISCLGTTNGLMMASSRSLYALAARRQGPSPDVYGQVDERTNMPNNASVLSLVIIAAWFVYFFLSNLAQTWTGPFVFDSSELPIITIYLMYLPMFIQWMRKEKEQTPLRRFIMPILALCGSVFMVVACIIGHGIGCLWYLIVFAVIMAIGALFRKKR